MVCMGMAAENKIGSFFPERRDIGKAAVEQDRVGANLNAQTDPLMVVTDTVWQTR